MSARQWFADNGINEKAYYYWLRKFHKEAYDQMQVPAVAQPTEVSFAGVPIPVAASSKSAPCTSYYNPVAILKYGNVSIEISNDISEEILSRLLQEVAHA